MGLVLSKLLWLYDFEAVSKDVDWLRDSRMAMLWQKPQFRVRVILRRTCRRINQWGCKLQLRTENQSCYPFWTFVSASKVVAGAESTQNGPGPTALKIM